MRTYNYSSYDSYRDVQIRTTTRKLGGGRTLAAHVRNIEQVIRTCLDLQHAVPASARIVCMGVRRGVELTAWELKGYRNVVGVELAPMVCNPKIINADFSELSEQFEPRSVDVIYANHSFEHSFDAEHTAQAWSRVLKETGIVWIASPSALGRGLDRPTETDPVLLAGVTDLESLFSPLRVVWSCAEVGGTVMGGGRAVNLNAILSATDELPGLIDSESRKHMKRACRRWRFAISAAETVDALGRKFFRREFGTPLMQRAVRLPVR
jgi:SAM-dependent methyltransferase